MTRKAFAQKVGKSRSDVTNLIRLHAEKEQSNQNWVPFEDAHNRFFPVLRRIPYIEQVATSSPSYGPS